MNGGTKNVVEVKGSSGKFNASIWEDKEDIVHVKVNGYHDLEGSKKIADEVDVVYREKGKKLFGLLDFTDLEETKPEARKYMAEKFHSEDSVFKSIAIFGCKYFIRTLMNLHARISRTSTRVFKTEDEAIAWLKGEMNNGK